MKNSSVLSCAGDVMGLDGGEGKKVSAYVYGKSFVTFGGWKLVYRTVRNSNESTLVTIFTSYKFDLKSL